MKLSNKATLSLRLLSKCSFTISKLRFFELRKPKISSCYTTSFMSATHLHHSDKKLGLGANEWVEGSKGVEGFKGIKGES